MDVGSIRSPQLPLPVAANAESPQVRAGRRDVIQAVKALQKADQPGFNSQHHEMTYAIDRASRKAVLKIVNRETQEVVLQIPSEEVIRLADMVKSR